MASLAQIDALLGAKENCILKPGWSRQAMPAPGILFQLNSAEEHSIKKSKLFIIALLLYRLPACPSPQYYFFLF